MPSYIVKADPYEDWYCMWSTIVDAPTAWGRRAELERSGHFDPREVAPERFKRADDNGTSANWPDWPAERQPFAWSDENFILMNGTPEHPDDNGCWLLPRENLRAFCEALDAERDTTDLCVWESHDEPADESDQQEASDE